MNSDGQIYATNESTSMAQISAIVLFHARAACKVSS